MDELSPFRPSPRSHAPPSFSLVFSFLLSCNDVSYIPYNTTPTPHYEPTQQCIHAIPILTLSFFSIPDVCQCVCVLGWTPPCPCLPCIALPLSKNKKSEENQRQSVIRTPFSFVVFIPLSLFSLFFSFLSFPPSPPLLPPPPTTPQTLKGAKQQPPRMPTEHLHQVCQSMNTQLARYPILAVGLPLVGGFLTAIPSHHAVKSYYEGLQKPEWAAPASVFAPVWAGLYITVGYASHLVALRTGPNTVPSIRHLARTGLGIYGLNLALNFAWSPLMFWKNKIGAALVTAGGLTVSSSLSFSLLFKSAFLLSREGTCGVWGIVGERQTRGGTGRRRPYLSPTPHQHARFAQ